MTPDAAGIEAALAAGLAAHRLVGFTVCRCGAQIADPMEGGEEEWEAGHRAHVAAALLPVVTQAQAGAWDEGYRARSLPNRWNGPRNGFGDPLNPHRSRADQIEGER